MPTVEENRAAWVAALRSEEYSQIRGQLRSGVRGRCCLGVGCDVIDPDGWVGDAHRGSGGVPVHAVEEALDIHDIMGALVQLNDLGTSFPEIADLIEAGNDAIDKAAAERVGIA